MTMELLIVVPPRRGTAVLACRCGRMLDAQDMRRETPPRDNPWYAAGGIRPICCPACAVAWVQLAVEQVAS